MPTTLLVHGFSRGVKNPPILHNIDVNKVGNSALKFIEFIR